MIMTEFEDKSCNRATVKVGCILSNTSHLHVSPRELMTLVILKEGLTTQLFRAAATTVGSYHAALFLRYSSCDQYETIQKEFRVLRVLQQSSGYSSCLDVERLE